MSGGHSSPKRETTRRFVQQIVFERPGRTAATVTLLVLANGAEGLSVLVLFPAVARVLGTWDGKPGGVSALLEGMVTGLGLPPSLFTLLALVLAGVVLKGLLTWVAMRQVGYVAADIDTELRLSLLSRLFRARWELFVREPLGRFAGAVGHEATLAATAYQKVFEVVSRVLQITMNTLVVFVVSWRLALLMLALGAGVGAVASAFTRVSRSASRAGNEARRALIVKLLDAVHGMKPIRAMGAERHFLPTLVADAHRVRQALRRQVGAAEGLKAAQEPLLVVGILLGLAFATRQLDKDAAAIAVVGFVLFRLAVQMRLCLGEVQYLVTLEPMYWSHREAREIAEAYEEPAAGMASPPALVRCVRLDAVSFRYEARPVLREVSMSIPARRMTVLVGASGVGKTTLLDLLMGIQRPTAGEIWLDAVALSQVSLPAWRQRIGYVPQEAFLVHDSVRGNIVLGDASIGDEAVRAALAAAGALDFVAQLPHGLHTPVGEQGSRLSAGQRQRIALARALVRRPALLILDEVTASLDPDTARGVVETLVGLRGETTVLAVTHQPDLLALADVTYELVDGRALLLGAEAR